MSAAVSNSRPKTPILPLTSVRIFAALYVVLLHSFLWTNRLYSSTWTGRFIRSGYTAVGFFFTLSGFILAHVYLNTDRPFDRRAFWTSRFARAYPLLFASLLLDLPRNLIVRIHLHGVLRGVLNSLLALGSETVLLQSLSGVFRNLNAPSWSLSDEAFFYLLFPVLAFRVWRWKRGQALALFFLLWLAALAIPELVTLRRPDLFTEVEKSVLQVSIELMPIFRIFEFLAGIALCAFQHSVIANLPAPRRSRIAWLALTAAGLLFFAAIQFSTHIPLMVMSDGFLLPVYGLIIVGLVNLDGPLHQLLSHPLFVLLGEASYAVYLLHWPVFTWCQALHPMNTPAMWTAYLALVLGLSIASFLFLERPVRRMILNRAAIRPAVTLQQEVVAPS